MSGPTGEVWVIRHKETKELWTAVSGKSSWNKPGHAKLAWANSWERRNEYCYRNDERNLFKSQDEYEVHNVRLVRPTDKDFEGLVAELRKLTLNEDALGCGLEDAHLQGTTYQAANYGFEDALEKMNEIINNFMEE